VQGSIFDQGTGTCQRCGRHGRGSEGNPEARLLRHAKQGVCVNCGVTEFLMSVETTAWAIELRGPQILLDPMIQRQFVALMGAGRADATPEEIDWQTVVANWSLPMTKKGRRR
jgi:hypothetical protein